MFERSWNKLLATELKENIERMSGGSVEISILDNKDILIRPAIDFNRAPDVVKAMFYEYLDTPREER